MTKFQQKIGNIIMNSNYLECILEDSTFAASGTDSDLSYVLRKMLLKGIKDAEYRSFWCSPQKSTIYKDMMLELESFLAYYNDTTFEDMVATFEGRRMIMDQIKVCECLASLDIMESRADFDNIVRELTHGISNLEQAKITSFI